MGAARFLWSGGSATSLAIEELGPTIVFNAAFGGEQGVGTRFRPAVPRRLEQAPDGLLAGAFNDAGSDRQSSFLTAVAAHSIPVGLELVDDAGNLPIVQLLFDPLRPRLPFALVRGQSLHGSGIFEGMMLIEDEGRIPSRKDLFADILDPCYPVAQYRRLLG